MSGKCAKVHQSSKYSSALFLSTTRFIKISHYLSFVVAHLRPDRSVSSVFLVISQLHLHHPGIFYESKKENLHVCLHTHCLINFFHPQTPKKMIYYSSFCHESAPTGWNIQEKVRGSSDKASGAGFILTPGVNRFHTWTSDAPERSSSDTRAWERLQQLKRLSDQHLRRCLAYAYPATGNIHYATPCACMRACSRVFYILTKKILILLKVRAFL